MLWCDVGHANHTHTYTHSTCMYTIHIAIANAYTDQPHLMKRQSRNLWAFFLYVGAKINHVWWELPFSFELGHISGLYYDNQNSIVNTHWTVDFILGIPVLLLFQHLLVSQNHCCNSSWSTVALLPFLVFFVMLTLLKGQQFWGLSLGLGWSDEVKAECFG